MNRGGLANRGGELIKELDELLNEIAPQRKLQADYKYRFEEVQGKMTDLTNFLYHQMTINPEIDWVNPEPILDAKGTPLPEFEANFRSMLINATIQQNPQFMDLAVEQDAAKLAYYASETKVVTLMEKIGVKRTQLNVIGALARLATDES